MHYLEHTYTKLLLTVSLKFEFNGMIWGLFCLFLILGTLGYMDGKSPNNQELKYQSPMPIHYCCVMLSW